MHCSYKVNLGKGNCDGAPEAHQRPIPVPTIPFLCLSVTVVHGFSLKRALKGQGVQIQDHPDRRGSRAV